MIILLCVAQQLKLKINYQPGFHMQRKKCLSKHPPPWTWKKVLYYNIILVTEFF